MNSKLKKIYKNILTINKTKKGFVISIDALVALLLILTMFIMASAYLTQIKYNASNDLLLAEISMDTATIMEKSGMLETAITSGRVQEIRKFLNKLPHSYCAEAKAYAENNFTNPDFLVIRPGCKKNFNTMNVTKRSFSVYNNGNLDFYILELSSWRRLN